MTTPAISVLLPTFNGGELLRESVASILSQTWRDFELLVIDDGSTDGSVAALASLNDPRLRLLTNPKNLGLTRTLNRGLAEGRGEFVARQDADDLSDRRRLERQMAFFRESPKVELLGTSAWRLTPEGRISGTNDLPTTHDALRWASVVDNPFLHTSVMFRRERVLGEFGGYDERFSVCQDFDLWSRIAERHPIANLAGRLVSMREHAASMTRTQSGRTTDEAGQILASNWTALFPNRPMSEEDRRLLSLFRQRFPARELPALKALLDALLDAFFEKHPEAHGSRDFRRTLCRQEARLAYKFLGVDPVAALGSVV